MRAALHLRQAWHGRWLFPLTATAQVPSRRGGLLEASAQLSTSYRHRALPVFRDARREIIRKYHREYPSLTLTRRAVKECFGFGRICAMVGLKTYIMTWYPELWNHRKKATKNMEQ